MSDISFVKKTVDNVRAARKSVEKIEFYSEMAAIATKYQLTYSEMAAYGASLLLVALVESAKTEQAALTDASAAGLQIVSDMTTDPQKMIELWTKS